MIIVIFVLRTFSYYWYSLLSSSIVHIAKQQSFQSREQWKKLLCFLSLSEVRAVLWIMARYEENLESIRGIPDQLQNMFTKKQQQLSLNNYF